MAGVGDERHRVAHKAIRKLERHKRRIQRDTYGEGAAEGCRSMIVRMVMYVLVFRHDCSIGVRMEDSTCSKDSPSKQLYDQSHNVISGAMRPRGSA